MTGLATMKLVEAGRLKLEDKLPKLLEQSVWETLSEGLGSTRLALLEQVTVRQLLSHTSGLSVSGFPGYPPSPSVCPTALEILGGKSPSNTPRVELHGLPGHCFSYSGGGLTVLQFVLEAVEKKPFAQLMDDLLFKPLNMTRSFFALPEGERISRGHIPQAIPQHRCRRTSSPSSRLRGLWTTPGDLLKAVKAVQESLENDSVAGEETFLQRELARQMLTEIDGYGLSWWSPRSPGTGFCHFGGNEPGWRCVVFGYADLKSFLGKSDQEQMDTIDTVLPPRCGISVMTNSAYGYDLVVKIVHAIAYLQGWPEFPGGFPNANIIPLKADGAIKVDSWREWIGGWTKKGRGMFSISPGPDGSPVVKFANLPTIRLLPAAMPPTQYSNERTSVDLVLEDLQMMLRLAWTGSSRCVYLWHGDNRSSTLLERAA